MTRSREVVAVLTLICVVLTGCVSSRSVTSEDLVGTWIVTDAIDSTSIVLRADGSATFDEVPLPSGKNLDGTGSWFVDDPSGRPRLYLANSLDSLILKIRSFQDDIEIVTFTGDPDSGDTEVVYRRD